MLIELIKHAIAQPTFVVHGVRKIVQGLYWEEAEMFPAMDILKDLGYQKGKVTRLMNLYYNREEVAKAKAKLAQRKGEEHSSVSISMRNVEKSHPAAQGWCIQNIVISESWQGRKRRVTADIFYRSTELIMKFGADLSLIKAVFDELEIDPAPIRFYFANAYVSAVFFPLLFSFTDPVELFEHIRRVDKKFHFLTAKAVSRYLDPNNRYTYRAQVKQWKITQDTVDRTKLDPYLLKHLGEYHELHLPKPKRRSTVRKTK
jgi:hypothetical protein